MDNIAIYAQDKVTQDKLAKEVYAAVKAYRDTALDANTSKEDLKEAANEAIRIMLRLLDAKNDTISALILAGKTLAEAATGQEPMPLS